MQPTYQPNAKLDLSFTRVVNVPRAQVWRAWTEPALLMPWFCPLPWKTIDCEIDLRPGGLFRTTMQSPDGAEWPNAGCYLDVVPQERLVWTNALLPGFRPNQPVPMGVANEADFLFTAMVELADVPEGTRYTATVIHADEAGCQKHAAMGFEAGWGAALDQLVAMVQRGI
jgi:uncharacterized protein YndB with AHSA1/START domain